MVVHYYNTFCPLVFYNFFELLKMCIKLRINIIMASSYLCPWWLYTECLTGINTDIFPIYLKKDKLLDFFK